MALSCQAAGLTVISTKPLQQPVRAYGDASLFGDRKRISLLAVLARHAASPSHRRSRHHRCSSSERHFVHGAVADVPTPLLPKRRSASLDDHTRNAAQQAAMIPSIETGLLAAAADQMVVPAHARQRHRLAASDSAGPIATPSAAIGGMQQLGLQCDVAEANHTSRSLQESKCDYEV